MRPLERIGLVAALPLECAGVLSWPGWEKEKKQEGVRLYCLKRQGLLLRLALGGMGEHRALEALDILLGGFQPGRVISLGLAGAVEADLHVGQVAWVQRVFKFTGEAGLLEGPCLENPPQGSELVSASMISLPGLLSKAVVRRALGSLPRPLLLDLETHALAQGVLGRGLSFWGIRAVSDEALLDAGPRVARWLDQDLSIRGSKVLVSLIRKPSELIFMAKLFARAREASRALGRSLERILFQS